MPTGMQINEALATFKNIIYTQTQKIPFCLYHCCIFHLRCFFLTILLHLTFYLLALSFSHYIYNFLPLLLLLLTSPAQKGLLHLSPDVYQEMEASRKQSASAPCSGGNSGGSVNYMTSKDMVSCSPPLPPGHSSYYNNSSSSPSPTASMARELLLNGQSPTTDTSLSMKGKNLACGVSVQPAQQLDYLARIQGFQVRCKHKNVLL